MTIKTHTTRPHATLLGRAIFSTTIGLICAAAAAAHNPPVRPIEADPVSAPDPIIIAGGGAGPGKIGAGGSGWSAQFSGPKGAAGCLADVSRDGVVDIEDLFGVLNALDSGEQTADANRDGHTDFWDLIAVLDAMSTGC